MDRKLIWLGIYLVALVGSVEAQTTVTSSGTTATTGNVPYVSGATTTSTTVSPSPITVSGRNVGIATTAPVTPLQVNGTITGGAGGSTSGQVILTGNYNGANDVLATWGTEYSSGAPLFGYGILPSTSLQGSFLSSSPLSSLPRAALTVGSNTGRITFFTGQSQSVAFGNPVNMNEVMVILNNGSVGIGTTSPTSLLSVGPSSQFQVNAYGAVSSGPIISSGPVGIGTSPQYTLDVAGQVHASQAIYASGGITFSDGSSLTSANTLCGGDYAEAMKPAGSKKAYEAGDVLVLTSGKESDVQKSTEPYSTMVAGIYATKPGLIGRRQSLIKDSDALPMAMVGVVPTKVSAENGPIRKGDLLVTASLPGYAMKGTDRNRMLGAVIGKAMGSLDKGTGAIEVLVTLQ